MNKSDPFKESSLKQLQLSAYLIPVLGFTLALWTVYRHQGSREQQSVSRLSITLTLFWLVGYSLLWAGAGQTSELLSIRLLYLNSLLTSGYFLVCIVLAIRLWQGKLPRLRGISKIAAKVGHKPKH